jgi:hypothetical protein
MPNLEQAISRALAHRGLALLDVVANPRERSMRFSGDRWFP